MIEDAGRTNFAVLIPKNIMPMGLNGKDVKC